MRLGKTSSNMPTLSIKNKYAETDLQNSNMFYKYFSSQSVIDDNNKSLPPPKTVLFDSLDVFKITPQSVKDVFDGLDVNKSCGPVLMSHRLLKEGSSILAEPYSFTSSVRLGHFPPPFQSGFVLGDSTTFQLLHTYHVFCEAVDSGKEVRAFDRV